MLDDPNKILANWLAMGIYGRSQDDPSSPTTYYLHSIRLSARSFALLFSDISWLQTLFDIKI